MQLINLTPHPVVLLDADESVALELPKFRDPPRAKEERQKEGDIRTKRDHPLQMYADPSLNPYGIERSIIDIPVNRVSLGSVEGLPEPLNGVAYIVSRIVAEAAPERDDLYIPDETVRDEEGRIIGCKALAQVH